MATSSDVAEALERGVAPAELAAALDPASLRRMTPALSPVDAEDVDEAVDIVAFKDRFTKPKQSGYRDLQLHVRASNGHIAEFRLHLSVMDEVAKWEHSLYEVRRDVDARAKVADRSMTVMEDAIVAGLLELERKLFWEALQASLSGR